MKDVLLAADRIRDRRGLDQGWRFSVMEMVVPALASRETGDLLVDECVLVELPRMRRAVASVLQEAGLLRRGLG
ncbi:hypothetical protein ACFT4A_35065 [Streptomyces sp. NPDC057099]|uniref:hypothetical protein n=1 Tax=Streptomyces sp. NPDC057099 TaxID=3346019 RepID=UPI003627558B